MRLTFKHFGPGLGGQAFERARNHAADVVHQDVETAELRGGFLDEVLAALLGREIRDDPGGFDAVALHVLDGCAEALLAARRQRDVAALLGEGGRDRVTDTLARAGDGRVLAFEAEIHEHAPQTTRVRADYRSECGALDGFG